MTSNNQMKPCPNCEANMRTGASRDMIHAISESMTRLNRCQASLVVGPCDLCGQILGVNFFQHEGKPSMSLRWTTVEEVTA